MISHFLAKSQLVNFCWLNNNLVETYNSGWVKGSLVWHIIYHISVQLKTIFLDGSLVWLVKNSRRLELDKTLACNQATESDHHDDHHFHDQQHTEDDDDDEEFHDHEHTDDDDDRDADGDDFHDHQHTDDRDHDHHFHDHQHTDDDDDRDDDEDDEARTVA